MLKIIEPKDKVLIPFSDNVNNLLTKNIENIVDKTSSSLRVYRV